MRRRGSGRASLLTSLPGKDLCRVGSAGAAPSRNFLIAPPNLVGRDHERHGTSAVARTERAVLVEDAGLRLVAFQAKDLDLRDPDAVAVDPIAIARTRLR